ncbi:hypothetical protein M0802_014893 [Mischocyttarus mexicanus]|nr:hypothetical protein M0802_014893 [Mischocyttarus mexicanus]
MLDKSLEILTLDNSLSILPLANSLGTLTLVNSLGTLPLANTLGTLPLDNSLGTLPLAKSLGILTLDKSLGILTLVNSFLPLLMDKESVDEELCLNFLSDYSSYSERDSDADNSDDDSSDSSINTRKPRKLLPLQYSDSEDNDDTAEVNIATWSTNDKSIILELFEGSPSIKILPKSEAKMKRFLGLIVLMGQVKKDRHHDYWSTDQNIGNPFFSKEMSRRRFMQILQSWHFCNNKDISTNSYRLVKVQPVINYLKKRFIDVYKPCQQLSLDKCIIMARKTIIQNLQSCENCKVQHTRESSLQSRDAVCNLN